jgi:hypothetical protein
MKQLLIITSFLLLGFISEDPKVIIKKNDYSVVDKLGNIFVIRKDEIDKYKESGLIKKYSRKAFGNISYVDASNALRILLFYKNANKIIFLDNLLSENSEVLDLYKLQGINASVVCNSSNNQFWLFDMNNSELLKINNDLSISLRTGNLRAQIDDEISPVIIKEINNQLYLVDKKLGVFIFDYFGTMIKKLPLFNIKNLYLHNDVLIYTNDENLLFQYDMMSFDIQKIDSCKSCKSVYYSYPYIIKEKGDSIIYKNLIL